MNLQERVDAIPYWYHRIELPGGIVTPGWAPLSAERYRLPDDLTGKRVLDVGAWDGYWTWECLKRGARQVVAIDDFSDVQDYRPAEYVKWDTFDLCRESFGYSDEQADRREMSAYDVGRISNPNNRLDIAQFDLILFFGTLYHCRHPLLALEKLAEVCKPGGEMLVESAICDDFSPFHPHGYGGRQFVMEFYNADQYGENPTNWWCPTLHCLAAMMSATGFEDIKVWKLTERPTDNTECRGFSYGRKVADG